MSQDRKINSIEFDVSAVNSKNRPFVVTHEGAERISNSKATTMSIQKMEERAETFIRNNLGKTGTAKTLKRKKYNS